jgi:putative aldouronate transport system substrate-binding protein
MKKWCIFLVFGVSLSMALFGGGQGGRPAGGREKVKLTVAIEEQIRIANYKTNFMTRWLEEQANVELEFVQLSATDYHNKLNLMVMTGGDELPDIIIATPGDSMTYQWAKTGAIIPLTKYYNNPALSPNLHDAVKRTGTNFFSQITSPDGEIYSIPSFNQSYLNEYPQKFVYYKPWVDKLGGKLPSTTEEFRAFLRQVVNTDLNGNGRKDEIGMAGRFDLPRLNFIEYQHWFTWLMNAFVYAGDNKLLTVHNGTVGAAYNTPEWREGLKYIRSLFAEGLILQESLTQDLNQMRTLINADGPRVFSFVWFNADEVNINNPSALGYVMGPPLRGPKGVQYASFLPSVTVPAFMISANCKNPDAAFKVGDLMASEYIGIVQRFGEEKVDWDYAKNAANADAAYAPAVPGFPLSILTYHDGEFWGGTAVGNASWRQKGPFIRAYGIANGWGTAKNQLSVRSQLNSAGGILYQNGGWAPKEVIPKLLYAADEIETVIEIETTLLNYVNEMTAHFIAGNRDIDGFWSTYTAEMEKIGLSKYLAIVQKVYSRMYR